MSQPKQDVSTSGDSKPGSESANEAAVGAIAADAQDWRQSLGAAISRLEEVNREPPQSQAEVGRHAALRMLYLLASRKDDALKPIAGISPSQQDFWSQEVYGLANVHGHGAESGNEPPGRRSRRTLREARAAWASKPRSR